MNDTERTLQYFWVLVMAGAGVCGFVVGFVVGIVVGAWWF